MLITRGNINEKYLILDDISKSLLNNMDSTLTILKGRFEKAVGKLNALSPLNTLSRGFGIITKHPKGTPVFSINDVHIGDEIKTRLKDGALLSRVQQIENKP